MLKIEVQFQSKFNEKSAFGVISRLLTIICMCSEGDWTVTHIAEWAIFYNICRQGHGHGCCQGGRHESWILTGGGCSQGGGRL